MTNEQDMQRQLLGAMDAAIQHFNQQHGDDAAMTVMRLDECKEIIARHAPAVPAPAHAGDGRELRERVPNSLTPSTATTA